MGNKLALDVNEAVINCLYLLPGEENPISSESKYIKSGTMSIQDKRIKTLKIRLADLTDIVIYNVQFCLLTRLNQALKENRRPRSSTEAFVFAR